MILQKGLNWDRIAPRTGFRRKRIKKTEDNCSRHKRGRFANYKKNKKNFKNVCANHFGTLTDDDYDYTDEGLHKFRFTVVPFGGKADCAKLTRIAECSGEPDYLLDTYHHGPLPRTVSRIECRSENISVTACKRGEDGGVVLRAYETAQRPTDATIVYDGQKITAHFAPNSVHTFLLTEDGVKETDFIERIKQNP